MLEDMNILTLVRIFSLLSFYSFFQKIVTLWLRVQRLNMPIGFRINPIPLRLSLCIVY